MGSPEPVEALVEGAEKHLVLGWYKAAECSALEALQRAQYSPNCPTELQDRAAVVLLQALYETSRFPSGRKLLCDFFGRLEAAPANALLVWLSLALDCGCSRRAAQALILQLLEAKGAGEEGWARRQYLALLHLYMFEVLLPEMREPSEVLRWLEATQLPLAPEERQALKEELRSLLPPPASTSPLPALPTISTGRAPERGSPSWAAAEPSTSHQQECQHVGQQQQQQQGGWLGGAGVGPGRPARSEIEEEPGAPANPAPSAPPGAVRQLADTARAAYHSSVGRWGGAAGGDLPRPSFQAAAGGVLGAVLLYALWAERQAIRRRAGRARRAAWQALGDLLRMALSVTPNPMAAPR